MKNHPPPPLTTGEPWLSTQSSSPAKGNFTIRLFDKEAPNTVANFVGLAEGTKEWTDPRTNQKVTQPYYDGIIFHRVIDGFMIQGGDPLGQGIGGPGYKFADEFHPSLRHSKARHPVDGQRRAEHQRRPVLHHAGPTPHLDNKHSVFVATSSGTLRGGGVGGGKHLKPDPPGRGTPPR